MRTKHKVNNFIKEVFEVCKKYQLSISHEDYMGSFIICDYDEDFLDDLESAEIILKDYNED